MANEGVAKFLESGGEDSSGLGIDVPRGTGEPKVVTEPAEPAPKAEEPKAAIEDPKLKADREARRKAAIDEFGLVDLNALTEARSEARDAKRQAAELAKWREQIEPTLKSLTPKENMEKNPYDPNTQPNEYQVWNANQEWTSLTKTVNELKTFKEQALTKEQATAQTQQVLGWAAKERDTFKAKEPAFDEAFNFAMESRKKDFESMGMTDPNAIEAALEADQAQIIMMCANATRQGTPMNPAEVVWKWANARGFTQKDKETPTENDATTKIQAGLNASGGLKGGSTPKAKYSMEDLAAMPTKTPKQKAEWRKAWEEVYGRAP